MSSPSNLEARQECVDMVDDRGKAGEVPPQPTTTIDERAAICLILLALMVSTLLIIGGTAYGNTEAQTSALVRILFYVSVATQFGIMSSGLGALSAEGSTPAAAAAAGGLVGFGMGFFSAIMWSGSNGYRMIFYILLGTYAGVFTGAIASLVARQDGRQRNDVEMG